MKRTSLLPAAALAVAALAPLTSYDAAQALDSSCYGQAPTMTGTPGSTVTGTEGPDVINTGGAVRVRALGGDDSICVTGVASKYSTLTIDAGTGGDKVDTTAATVNTSVDLGEGDDGFDGGTERDTLDIRGGGHDVVFTGDGRDIVTTGPGSGGDVSDSDDVVDLGDGNDSLTVMGSASGATLDGGRGQDSLKLFGGDGNADWLVRNGDVGSASRAGGTVATWSRFEDFDLSGIQANDLTFRGGPEAESVSAGATFQLPGTVHLFPGAGDDTIEVDGIDDYDVVGGPGRDLLEITSDRYGDAVRVDLAQGRFYFTRPSRATVTGVQDVTVNRFYTARLLGNKAGNRLTANGAYTLLRLVGRDGPDVLRGDYSRDVRMNGGNGADRLLGTRYNDLLIGGAGRDRANGNGGTDRCPQVELRISCEK